MGSVVSGTAPVTTNGTAPKLELEKNKDPAAAPAAAPTGATIPVNVTPGAAGGKRKGGYRPTKKDKAALKKLKQGKSIGFTMRSSLKAKGLLRRANGTKRVSAKYRKN